MPTEQLERYQTKGSYPGTLCGGVGASESQLIRSFYTRIISKQFPKANQQYREWKTDWESLQGPIGRKKSGRTDVLAKRYAVPEEELDAPALLFAIETYYVIRLRLKAYLALTNDTSEHGSALVNRILSADTFTDLGIENYGGGELFDWILECADEEILSLVDEEFRREYQREFTRHATPFVPEPRDEVGPLFQSLVPKQFRHSAGAHYTPDWLADYILLKLGYKGDSQGLVDPHCGSGTFLIAALRRAYEAKRERSIREWHALLSEGICGFDVDPVATLAAKTNLLLFVSWLISTGRYRIEKPLTLPVFCRDTICSTQKQNEKFDFVVGNPPWINWEYLPNSYKERIKPLWPKLSLVDFKGTDKAFSKVDLSVLATYVACNELLKPNGKLGFVLPQSTFKSPKNAKGFRRFQIGAHGPHLKVLHVDDLSTTSVFDQASNRPAILFLEKGPPTTYPVSYATWMGATRKGATRNGATRKVDSKQWTNWNDAAPHFTIRPEKAQPVDANDPSSSWIHAPESVLSSYDAIAGQCPYRARTGVFTGGANGVFYLQRLRTLASGNLIVKNIVDRTRRKTAELEFEIEPHFVYPFLRGRDVDSWRADVDPDRIILCPHTLESGMRPVKPQDLKQSSPQTHSYLSSAREVLEARQGFTGFDHDSRAAGFYTLLRIGDYTFKPFKVVWRYISKTFKCCVIGPASVDGRLVPVLPQEKLMLIGFDEPLEAYYVCGMLSSTPIRSAIESRMVGTQISASVIEHIGMPKFDVNNPRHVAIAEQCRLGHEANSQ